MELINECNWKPQNRIITDSTLDDYAILGNVKDYLKCSWKNKFTLAGYLMIGVGTLDKHTNLLDTYTKTDSILHSEWMIPFGTLFLLVTTAGLRTLRAYQRTKNHIKRYGEIDACYDKYSSMYCTRVGMKLAIKENGLLELYKQKRREDDNYPF